MSFRPMVPADLNEVMAVERTSFRHPWSSNFFLEELQVACARSILAQVNDRIVGYILFWLLPEEIDVHNIAVHPGFRRQGIGQTLLRQVIEQAQRRDSSRVTLEVRVSNVAAQKLYESVGFVRQGLRKGYYSDDGEDALIMTLQLAHR
ncbi:MAG TPA: ribosomal protein S18-alanine N-acetyltransferase [Candidatus Binatia bacterium]|nr:ribosomal protein S18-alanine N-acetyltransferase [Candidatus Binatia bacterium]